MKKKLLGAEQVKLTHGLNQVVAYIDGVYEDANGKLKARKMRLPDKGENKMGLARYIIFNDALSGNTDELFPIETKNNVPFSINEAEFDMSKFTDRFRSFLKVSNLRHSFYGN